MAVLDFKTGKRVEQAPAQQPQTADPLAESNNELDQFKNLLIRQAGGESGLEESIAALQGRLSQQPKQERAIPQPTEEDIASIPEFRGQDFIPGPKDLLAAGDVGLTLASGAIAEPVAGVAGLLSIPSVGAENAGKVVQTVRDFITLNPSTEQGEASLDTVGRLMSPITNIVQSAEKTLGDAGFDIGGPAMGAILKAIPAAVLEAFAFKGVSKLATGKAAKAKKAKAVKQAGLDVEDVGTIERTIEGATESTKGLKEATGADVGLFPAQKTQLPSELIEQRFLTQIDPTSRQAVKALEKQNKQVFDATTELINKVGGEAATEAGASRFRTASNIAVDARRQARTAQTKGLYDEAIKEGATVNLESTRGIIEDILLDAPPGSEFSKVGNKLRNLIRSPAKGGDPSFRQLQKAKITMQDMLDDVSDSAAKPHIKREIAAVKKELIVKMRESSKLFAKAEDEFIKLSPAVKQLEDSILGQVSKIKDTDLKNIAQKIFDPKASSTDPTAIIKAKKIIDNVDPGAWDDLLKVELNRRVSAMIETIGEADLSTANIPGQLKRAIFGNAKQRQALFAGMSKEQKKNFSFLEDVLKRSEKGRQAGSPSIPFLKVDEKLKGGIMGSLREKFFEPLKTFQKTGEKALYDRRARQLAEIMFNAKFEPALSKLRKLDPSSAKAGAEFNKLFENAKIAGAGLPLVKAENNENE